MERSISQEQLPISSKGEVDEKRRELLSFGASSVLTALVAPLLQSCRKVIASCKDAPTCENPDEILKKYKQVFEIVDEMEDDLKGLDLKKTVLCLIQKYLKGNPGNTVYGWKHDRISDEESDERCAKIIAHNIVLDIQKKLPWSLSKLSKDELRALFEFDYFYKHTISIPPKKYASVDHIPSDPEQIFEFMKKNELIKENHEQTIYAVINWFRTFATHDSSKRAHREHMKRYGHKGPPTTMDLFGQAEKFGRIDIMGCGASARLLKNMLASVGIPARSPHVILDGRGHRRIEFTSIGKAVIHGDDLHAYKRSGHLRPDGKLAEVPVEAILVPNKGLDGEQAPNYHRLHAHLIETYLPDNILFRYAEEKLEELRGIRNPEPDLVRIHLGAKRANEINMKIEAELKRIGNGDYAKAVEILKARLILPSDKPIL